MDSHVVLANSGVGPKMCVEDCMLYNGCNALNFKLEDLMCELLNVSYPGDSTQHVSILPKDNYTKSDEILNDLIKF
jgi:hypothetical protein